MMPYAIEDILREVRMRLDETDNLNDHTMSTRTVRIIIDRIEKALEDFLESKKSFYCTNTECPLKKTLAEEKK